MKRIFLPKNYLSFILFVIMLFGCNFSFAQTTQTDCWQQGDMKTYSQIDWGTANTTAGSLLGNYFATLYGTNFVVGGNFTLTFRLADAVFAYLPDAASAGGLTGSLLDPTRSDGGQLAGEVIALQLNVDFSDANHLNDVFRLGDLIFHDVDDLPLLNGQSVREVLATLNTLLGGGTAPFNISVATGIASTINDAFKDGTPSQFAQEHLKPGWQQGEMTTYSQTNWGNSISPAAALLAQNFFNLYGSNLEVGSLHIIHFRTAGALLGYLPDTGNPGVLSTGLIDPTSSSGGELAGEVIALKLNIDFSDANLLNNAYPFGDLIFHDVDDLPILNGLSVRVFLDLINTTLGGGNSPFNPSVASAVARTLNAAFLSGTPSEFAQDHLKLPCENVPTNHCPTTTASSVATAVGTAINIQLQAADEDNDALSYTISQNPSHGTVSVSATGLATYTPTAGYSGTDQFKFKASDGTCDAEAVVDLSIVVCPKGKGDWKNKPGTWPVSSLTLGTQTYTETELLNILNMPVGSGPKADASLILAHQLIPAKLSIANGTVAGSIATTIAHANVLLSAFAGKLPYKIKPNTTAGKAMTADASLLENFNGGSQTTGCTASQPAARLATVMVAAPIDFILEQNQPNPFYNTSIIRYHLPVEAANYRVTLKLYDVLGREIKTLVDEKQGAGVKTISFNAASLSGGVYYYRLTAGRFAAVRKMILVK